MNALIVFTLRRSVRVRTTRTHYLFRCYTKVTVQTTRTRQRPRYESFAPRTRNRRGGDTRRSAATHVFARSRATVSVPLDSRPVFRDCAGPGGSRTVGLPRLACAAVSSSARDAVHGSADDRHDDTIRFHTNK